MNKDLLKLRPTRFLCPYCGEWHEWKIPGSLIDNDKAIVECEYTQKHKDISARIICFYFSDVQLMYETKPTCRRANFGLSGKITIENIFEDKARRQIFFKVPFTPADEIGNDSCCDCSGKNGNCQLYKLADVSNGSNIMITFGFEFEQSDYDKYSDVGKLVAKNCEEEKSSKAEKESNKQHKKKEANNMANNVFNMNLEFGMNTDENLASTLMGIAVKNGESWRIYDKKKKEITDVGDMQLGNLPIYIRPTTKLAVGDLIKDGDGYYFVEKVEKGKTQTLCATTGELKTIIPIKNILGLTCYSKVIALSDSLECGEDFDTEKLAIMSAMCGQPDACNQMLPLMLCKDELGGADNVMKLMTMSTMINAQAESGEQNTTINQLLSLMLLKDKGDGDDDMMKLALMSSIGANMNGNNNPIMTYFMIDTLMGKKKEDKNSSDK